MRRAQAYFKEEEKNFILYTLKSCGRIKEKKQREK